VTALSDPIFMLRRILPATIRRRYAAKLGVAFLVVVLLTGAIGGYMYFDTSEKLERDAKYQMRNSAEAQASQVNAWVKNSRRLTKLISSSQTIKSDDSAKIQPYLKGLVADDQMTAGARAIHYVDASSTRILTSTLDDRVNATPRDEGAPWAQQDLTGLSPYEVEVSAFNPSVTNATVVTFITLVPGTTDRALVYVATMEGVSAKLQPPSQTAFSTAVGGDGTLMLHQRNPAEVGTQHIEGDGIESPAVKRGLDGESGYTTLSEDDRNLVMGYAPVESADWVVMVHDTPKTLFSLRRDVSEGVLLLLLTSIVGLGLVGLTIGRGTLGALTTLTSKARSMEEGDLDVSFESDREDEIGDLFAAFESMRDSLRETLGEVEDERERSERLVSHLEEKAADYGRVMEATADGDLTRRVDPESRSDAMTQIGTTYNRTLDELESTLADVAAFADVVADSSQQTTAGIEEVENASEEVTRSVQEISDGASEQSESLGEVSDELNQLSATIEEIASSTDEVATQSRRATERGETGREFAEEAVRDMDRIRERTDEAVDSIEQLSERMTQIEEIVDLIDRIAQQTNTLALNASVEAANAGEAGDGFAVVADEVKSLATETKEATGEVGELIAEIREGTTSSVEDMREMRAQVEDGQETIDDALGALQEIVAHVDDANAGVQEIDSATDEQATSAQEVATVVEDVANISEETSAESETVAAAAQEQTASLMEVSDNVQDLAARASRLQEVLSAFEVREDARAADATRRSGGGTIADPDGPAVPDSGGRATSAPDGGVAGGSRGRPGGDPDAVADSGEADD
jgi:methyl-accepting chemotaxis protein